MQKIIFAVFTFLLLAFLTAANGGFIKLAENNHLVSVSIVPISPSVGEKQQALVSFVYNYSLIKEKVQANVSVKKGGKTIFFESKSFTGGVMSLSLTYPEEGIYEVFVEFAKESEPSRVYAPEDFLVQVKNGGASGLGLPELLLSAAVALAAGILVGRKTK